MVIEKYQCSIYERWESKTSLEMFRLISNVEKSVFPNCFLKIISIWEYVKLVSHEDFLINIHLNQDNFS